MSYCGNCGAQVGEGQSFCGRCGAPVGEAGVNAGLPTGASSYGTAAQQSGESALQKLAALRAQAPPATKSSGKKILIVVLAVFLVGTIAAVAGVVYVGYRVKQKASAALNNLEAKSGAQRGTSAVDLSDSSKTNPGNNGDDASGRKSEKSLADVLDKLQGNDGGSPNPAGNMAKDILEDLGAKNPEIPPDLVRNIPYSAVTSPLPCPSTTDQIDPEKLASGRILFKPGTILTYSWSLPLADAESDNIIRSVSPASLIFEQRGVAASDIAMTTKSYPDFNQTVCAKDIVEGEAQTGYGLAGLWYEGARAKGHP